MANGGKLYRDNILVVRTNLFQLRLAVEDPNVIASGLSLDVMFISSDLHSVDGSRWDRTSKGALTVFHSDEYANVRGELRFRHEFPPIYVRLDRLELIGLCVNVNLDGQPLFQSRLHLMLDDNVALARLAGQAAESTLRHNVLTYNSQGLYSRPRRPAFKWETAPSAAKE